MVMRRGNLNKGRSAYELPGEEYDEYKGSLQTGGAPVEIFVDKSQHITQYIVNVNVTGGGERQVDSGAKPAVSAYVHESEVAGRLLVILDEMEGLREDPAGFEQTLGGFLSVLAELYGRRGEREVHFSDLVSMLQMGLANAESSELSGAGIAALREVVEALPHRASQETVEKLRQRLQGGGVDLLKPFRENIDVKSLLRELYEDEVTT